MFGFVFTPAAKIIAVVVATVALFSFGYYKGYSNTQEKFDQYKAEVAAEAKAQQDKIAAEVKTRQNITKKAEVTREKSRASIRSTYSALRLRVPPSSGPVPAVPNATADAYGAAAYYVSAAPELAESCAQTTQQLIELQDWIKDQQAVDTE